MVIEERAFLGISIFFNMSSDGPISTLNDEKEDDVSVVVCFYVVYTINFCKLKV